MRPHSGLLAAAVLAVGGTVHAQSPPATPAPLSPPPPPTSVLAPPATQRSPGPVDLPLPPPMPVLPDVGLTPAPATQPAAAAVSIPSAPTVAAPPPSLVSPSTQPAVIVRDLPGGQATTPGQIGDVIVTSDLNQARGQIAPSLGAATYTLGPAAIANVPGGENAPFQQVLLRAPGVVADSFGQFHVRGEHNNVTYRVNGVLLPEGLNGFGQELDSRIIDSVTLIDGTLPAEFGFRTAGIVDVNTKEGDQLKSNEISFYGGTYDTLNPSVQFGGSVGKLDYFVTGSFKHDSLGIENLDSTLRPIHDNTDQERGFGYFSYHLDDTSRVSLLLNGSYANFQIPDSPGLPQLFDLKGHPFANSADVNEDQNEQDYYSVLSYQKTLDQLSFQLSAFTRYGQIRYSPDPSPDLIFQGVSSRELNSFFTNGVQADASYDFNAQHTLRFGGLVNHTDELLQTTTGVFDTDPLTGAQTTDSPVQIPDRTELFGVDAGVYVQDEWRLNKQLTLNYGLRYDQFDASFVNEGQLSPRVNLVWKPDQPTTYHIGYARYFDPPPVQYVYQSTLRKFTNTTNAPGLFTDDPTKPERSHYFDAGVSREVAPGWTVGVDGFYKLAYNLTDLGQFGEAVVLSPYSYSTGHVYGTELSTTYKSGGWDLFGNLNWVVTDATNINSQQYEFDPGELAYISDHYIKLDHEAEFSGSAGVSYTWKNDRVYADLLYSSGLRAGFANLEKEPQNIPVSLGYEHIFHPNGYGRDTIRFRADCINVFDENYQIRQGGGLGILASQYGQRRSFYAGLAYDF